MFTVVLDDDPTGTQSATGVTVLLEWDAASIAEVLRASGSVYLQTNSRAIDAVAAKALSEAIRADIRQVELELGEPILVVLRGDSTLRGHVFVESDVFAGSDGRILFVPAFPQGGRTTIDSVHRVVIDGVDTPVGETEFARDPVFGYRNSHLIEWVAEQGTRGAVAVSLDELRTSAGAVVASALAHAAPGELILPDVENDADVELVYRGLLAAIADGVHVVVRSAATLAAICAGRLSTSYLDRPIRSAGAGAILVVCGSHTGAATAQLRNLERALGIPPVVIATDDAYADPHEAGLRAAAEVKLVLTRHGIAILSSERDRRANDDSLVDGELVMRSLMTATGVLAQEVATFVSKGGITSAEVARTAFGATRALVRGQVAAGISVWDFDAGDRPGVQIVVPGNVGGANALVDVVSALGKDVGENG